MKHDHLDLARRVDEVWTIISMAIAIGATLFLMQSFHQADRRYEACMKAAGRDYWKQQECRNGQAPAR